MQAREADSGVREALLQKSAFDVFELAQNFSPSRCRSGRRYLFQKLALNHYRKIDSPYIPRALLSLIKRFLYASVPQLIRTRYFNDPVPVAKIHSTSWMNGIRGIAAVCVFNQHYLNAFTWTVFTGYGTDSTNKWIHQLPILMLPYDGMSAIVVFFTISGYVCSSRPLQAITDGDNAALFRSLPASVFRRWFRLYLPAFCWTFCICVLAYLGAYEPFRFLVDDIGNPKIFPGPAHGKDPPRYPTVSQHLGYWWATMSGMVNFWTEFPRMPPIDRHLWTIVEEFRSSMHLYIVLVALAACKTWARISLLLFLAYIYIGRFGHWVPVAFFLGAAFAQLDILRLRKEKEKQQQRDQLYKADDDVDNDSTNLLPSPYLDTEAAASTSSSSPSRSLTAVLHFCRHRCLYALRNHRLSTSVRFVLYVVALYLMSFPHLGLKQPSLLYKDVVVPLVPYFYNKGVGALFPKQIGFLLLMYLLSSLSTQQRAKSLWHRFLTCGVSQYLGSIMFGLYLVHGTVQHVIGFALPHVIWRRWSAENNGWEYAVPQDMSMYLGGLLVGWAVTLGLTLCAADVWTREVEGRCVRVTKWLEEWVFVKK